MKSVQDWMELQRLSQRRAFRCLRLLLIPRLLWKLLTICPALAQS